MSDKPSFFSELKRRNVYKVAVAYAVASWLLIQIATQVFPFFEIPNWAVRLVVLVLIAGFPVALVFSWAFEITPEGIKRESEVEADKSITHHTGRKIVALTVVLAVIAAGLLAFQLWGPKRSTSKQADSAIPEKSIAVLPFDSLSEDKSNAFFAEGVQDEILTRLAKVADLKVIARTSTQKFKSAPENLSDIAKQLGVLNILEGSVQKANDQVRVNVQLINAMTNAHLWAEIYDRKLTDIFAVESDIAKTIADTLQAKLSGSEKTAISKKPTENSEAYELYLKGRFFWNKRTAGDMQKAADYYNQATATDPNYALAYAGLAEAYVLFPDYGVASPSEFVPRVKAAAAKALSLDPTLAEPHAALGEAYSYYDYDVAKSIAEFERAIQLNPNYATAHQWFNTPLQMLGNFDRAIAETKRAIELDPLSLIINSDLAFTYLTAHRFDEALAKSRKVLEMDTNFHVARGYLAEALQLKGQLPEAIVEYRKAAGATDQSSSLAQLAQGCARAGQRDEAEQILARLLEASRTHYVSGYVIAWIYAGLGDKARALEALENAYAQHASELTLVKYDPLFGELHGDPRFEALVQKVVGPKGEAKP
jgi:TolB-like protein/Tfp pilus assembly protein PilF